MCVKSQVSTVLQLSFINVDKYSYSYMNTTYINLLIVDKSIVLPPKNEDPMKQV